MSRSDRICYGTGFGGWRLGVEAEGKRGYVANALCDRNPNSLRCHFRLPIVLPFRVLRIGPDFSLDDADHSGGVPARGAPECDRGGHPRYGWRFSDANPAFDRA